MTFNALPGAAIVVRTVKTVFVSAAVERPRGAIAFPHGGEKHVRVVRIENDVDAAGAVIEIQNFFLIFAAVASAKNSALGIRAIGMSQSSDENGVGICGMCDHFADVARIFQADICPGLATIIRTVNAVAKRNISADAGFAGAG